MSCFGTEGSRVGSRIVTVAQQTATEMEILPGNKAYQRSRRVWDHFSMPRNLTRRSFLMPTKEGCPRNCITVLARQRILCIVHECFASKTLRVPQQNCGPLARAQHQRCERSVLIASDSYAQNHNRFCPELVMRGFEDLRLSQNARRYRNAHRMWRGAVRLTLPKQKKTQHGRTLRRMLDCLVKRTFREKYQPTKLTAGVNTKHLPRPPLPHRGAGEGTFALDEDDGSEGHPQLDVARPPLQPPHGRPTHGAGVQGGGRAFSARGDARLG